MKDRYDDIDEYIGDLQAEIRTNDQCATHYYNLGVALLAKGARLGVVLSFMMGVTTLSLPSLILLRKAVKPRLLGIFVGVCTVGILIVGYLFNGIQGMLL